MMSSGTNFVMTVIGFSLSILFIVYVCTRLICARIHLSASRTAVRTTSRFDLGVLERGLHENGLEPSVIASFPTKKYNDAYFSSAEDAQCTVCLGEYGKEETLRILHVCGHYFHATCIDIWLQQHSTCPVCRISLRELPEKKHLMQPMFCSAVQCQHMEERLEASPYHFLIIGHEFSGRAHNNCGINSVQED